MERQKLLLIFGLLSLGLVCVLSLCLGFTLAAASRRLAMSTASAEGAVQSATATTGFPTALPGETATPSYTPTVTPTLTVSAALSTEAMTATVQVTAPATATLTETPTAGPTATPTSYSLAQDAWCIPWNAPAISARVLRVIDGVTIEVDLGGQTAQVRYIGVDLLDYSEDDAIWQSMTDQNVALVGGKTVLLLQERSDRDADGRLLRYVIADSLFVNWEMAARGYAIAMSALPDISCDERLLEAEQQAILAKRGLWGPQPTPTRTLIPLRTPTPGSFGNIIIMRVAYRGTPWEEAEEYVEIYNDDDGPVQLQGWSLRDNERHVFIFPRFILGPAQYCRVYTDTYRPKNCGFTYYNPGPIWNNDGDCAYLKDPNGLLIDTFCYD